MAYLAYLFRRVVAIALGLALTAYSAWASWTHQGDLIGPLAALSAAVLLAFCEYAWRDRRWVHFGLLGLLGLAAAAISGLSARMPAASTAEACTNTSLPPSSGVMKPKPFAELKNLTVPLILMT
jgi:hypothetical protein